MIITVKIARVNHWAADPVRCLTACGEQWTRGKHRRDALRWPTRRKVCPDCAAALNEALGTAAPV